jgi:hypothetical protein
MNWRFTSDELYTGDRRLLLAHAYRLRSMQPRSYCCFIPNYKFVIILVLFLFFISKSPASMHQVPMAMLIYLLATTQLVFDHRVAIYVIYNRY